jgi:hypothetical protein
MLANLVIILFIMFLMFFFVSKVSKYFVKNIYINCKKIIHL